MKIRLILIWLSVLATLVVVNWQALRRENLAANGTSLFLELQSSPPFPIYGNSISLHYAVARNFELKAIPRRGTLVAQVDQNKRVTMVRLQQADQALAENEHLVQYHRTDWELYIGAESYSFQEGDEELYQNARYSEIRVSPTGEVAVVGLYDQDFKRLGR